MVGVAGLLVRSVSIRLKSRLTTCIQVALLTLATPGVAPLTSLAPVTWTWCCRCSVNCVNRSLHKVSGIKLVQ